MSENEIATRAPNPFGMAMAPKVETSNALSASGQQREVAEVQAAMMIARMNPRDVRQSMDRILNACTRPTLARRALYTYARGGSDISGPSIRLAEAIAQQWGNFQFGIEEIEQRPGESTVRAFAWDVETNTRQVKVFQVPHVRYTRQEGNKPLYDPRDIYEMIANMGARRLRACILGVIPGDVVEAAVNQAALTLEAEFEITPDLIASLLKSFGRWEVSKEHIEKRIQRRIESIVPAQVVSLHNILNSLRDGMSAPHDWFEIEPPSPAVPDAVNAVNQRLAEKKNGNGASKSAAKPQAAAASDPAKADNAAGATADPGPAMTFAQVADALVNAKDVDQADVAGNLIGSVADESQRAELSALYKTRRQELA